MKIGGRLAPLLLTIFSLQIALSGQAPGPQQQPEFVKQGQQFIREGKPEAALALYRSTLESSPNSLSANIATGNLLDLMFRESKVG